MAAARTAMGRYVACYNAGDADGVARLFAEGARLSHPVRGTIIGRGAIASFYARHLADGATRLEILSLLEDGRACAAELLGTNVATGEASHVLDRIAVDDHGLIEVLTIYRGGPASAWQLRAHGSGPRP